MSIIEIRGGPITHTYLIRKYNKSELAYEVLDHIRAAEEYRKEIVGLKQRLQQVVQADAKKPCAFCDDDFCSCEHCGRGESGRRS